jgi:hypothetical protein
MLYLMTLSVSHTIEHFILKADFPNINSLYTEKFIAYSGF